MKASFGRSVVVFGSVLGSLLGCFVFTACLQAEEKQHPYNVLFIAIDDLNDWTGFLGGHPQTQTPHMDKLAAQGVVYEREIDPMEWKNLASDPQYNAVKRAMEQYFPTVNVPEVKKSRPTN